MSVLKRVIAKKQPWFVLVGLALLLIGAGSAFWTSLVREPVQFSVSQSPGMPLTAGQTAPIAAPLTRASWIELPAPKAGAGATISFLKPLAPAGAVLHDAAATLQSNPGAAGAQTARENDLAPHWVMAPVANPGDPVPPRTPTLLRPGVDGGPVRSWPSTAAPESLPAPVTVPDAHELLLAPAGNPDSQGGRTAFVSAPAAYCTFSPSPLTPGASRAAGGHWPMLLTAPVVETSCPVRPLIWPEFLYGSPDPAYGDQSIV